MLTLRRRVQLAEEDAVAALRCYFLHLQPVLEQERSGGGKLALQCAAVLKHLLAKLHAGQRHTHETHTRAHTIHAHTTHTHTHTRTHACTHARTHARAHTHTHMGCRRFGFACVAYASLAERMRVGSDASAPLSAHALFLLLNVPDIYLSIYT